jgi:putative membrane fusion protein
MEEGMLLKQGTKIVQFSGKTPEKADFKYSQVLLKLGENIESNNNNINQAAGVVTYHVDGYEKTLTPENITKFTKEELEKISNTKVLNIDETTFYKGDPIFKIVNNGGWYIIYFVENARANLYEKGKSVTVQFSDDNVNCIVDSIEEIDSYTRIVLSCNRYYIRYPYVRVENISVLISEEQGVIIDNKSIFELNGQTGVYLKNKLDENVFKPVKVIVTDNEKSVVYSKYYNGTDGMPVETIEPYDEVVKSPKVDESSKEELL